MYRSDVAERTIQTLVGDEIARAGDQLGAYEIIGAVGVRPLLRALNVDPGAHRLAELGPPQKTRQLMLPAPWVHRDEPTLYSLLKEAQARDVPLEVVVGSAPGWADPWSRVQRAHVAADAWGSPSVLVDEQGYEIPRAEVQLARLADVPGGRP